MGFALTVWIILSAQLVMPGMEIWVANLLATPTLVSALTVMLATVAQNNKEIVVLD